MRASYAEELLSDWEAENAREAILTGERPYTNTEIAQAVRDAKTRPDCFYINGIVMQKVSGLSKSQLLDLLLVVEIEGDFRRCLSFADSVEGLFTEEDERGYFHPHINVRSALRGIVAVKLCFR